MIAPLVIRRGAPAWEDLVGRGISVSRKAIDAGSDLVTLGYEGARGPGLVIAPPRSGHASILMLDLALAIGRTRPVHIVDAADPETAAGSTPPVDLDRQITQIHAAILAARALTGAAPHLLGACQSTGPTVLAAAASEIASLTLLAAPLAPHMGDGVAAYLQKEGLERVLTKLSPLYARAGNGEEFLPGRVQVATIMAGPGGAARILASEGLVAGSPFAARSRRVRARRRVNVLCGATSIPRRLIEEGLDLNFAGPASPRNRVSQAARAIRGPVHLIAGGRDRIIPAKQTLGATDIFSGPVWQTEIPGADHFDMFCGEVAAHSVPAEMSTFFDRVDICPEASS